MYIFIQWSIIRSSSCNISSFQSNRNEMLSRHFRKYIDAFVAVNGHKRGLEFMLTLHSIWLFCMCVCVCQHIGSFHSSCDDECTCWIKSIECNTIHYVSKSGLLLGLLFSFIHSFPQNRVYTYRSADLYMEDYKWRFRNCVYVATYNTQLDSYVARHICLLWTIQYVYRVWSTVRSHLMNLSQFIICFAASFLFFCGSHTQDVFMALFILQFN